MFITNIDRFSDHLQGDVNLFELQIIDRVSAIWDQFEDIQFKLKS